MRRRPSILAALLLALACLCQFSPGASARAPHLKSVPAASTTGSRAVFPLRTVAARKIRSAKLRIGQRVRVLRVRAVRRAARSGSLQVSLPSRLETKPVLVLTLAPPPSPTFDRLYSSTSPWNQVLPANPEIDPGSPEMVEKLVAARAEKGFPIALREWTVPVYYATTSTPRYTVSLRSPPSSWGPVWGTPDGYGAAPPGWRMDPARWGPQMSRSEVQGPTRLEGVPIPAGAQPDPEIDAHMTIIDRAGGCEYDLYAAHREDGGWAAVWGNSTRLDASGIYPHGLSSKASGFAGAAGLIFPEEIQRGHIDHALFMSFPFTKAGGPVAPATSSDGLTDTPGAIPMGARIQLDPRLDLSTLGLDPYELTVARALQEYGMIVGDTGGALSLFAVNPLSYDGEPYAGLLPPSAYAYLQRIPVDRFRVLDLPPQEGGPLQIEETDCARFG